MLLSRIDNDFLIGQIKQLMSMSINPNLFPKLEFYGDTVKPNQVITEAGPNVGGETQRFLINTPFLKFYRKEENRKSEYYYIRQYHSYYAFMSGDGSRWFPFCFPHFDMGKVSFCNTTYDEVVLSEKNPLLYISDFKSGYINESGFIPWMIDDFIDREVFVDRDISNKITMDTLNSQKFMAAFEEKSGEEILNHVNRVYELVHDSYKDDKIYDFNDFEAEIDQEDSRPVGTATAG